MRSYTVSIMSGDEQVLLENNIRALSVLDAMHVVVRDFSEEIQQYEDEPLLNIYISMND